MKKKIKNNTPARSIKHTNTHHPLYISIFGVLSLLIVGLTFALLAYKPPARTPTITSSSTAQQSLGPKKGIRWIDTQADRDNLRNKPIVLRDAYSTHFKNDDGTVTALFTGFKQNYEVAPGIWEPIDYSLEKSKDPRYDYQTKNGVGIYLSRNGVVARKENDLFLEAGAPTLGLFNPNTQSFVKLKNLDKPKVTKDNENNSLVLDGDQVKLIVYASDVGVREDLILKNNSIVKNASDNDLLTLKAPLTTTGKITINKQQITDNKYELTSEDSLILEENGKTVAFPFPEGHDAKQNKAEIRRFLVKENNTWFLYTSVSANWLKRLSTSYPVTVDPDYAGDAGDRFSQGFSTNYQTARGTGTLGSVTLKNYIGQLKSGSNYYIYRTFIKFVTSGIPDSAQINQVNLKFQATNDISTTVDFDVRVVSYNWSAQDPLTTAGNIDPAHDGCLNATTTVLWRNTLGMSVNTTYTSNNLDTSWPSVTGNTYYCLQSDREKAGTIPTGSEYIYIQASTSVVLTITYQPAAVVATAATNVTDTSFSANWNTQSGSGANGYRLDVGTDNPPTQFVNGCGGASCNNFSVGNFTTYGVTGLNAETTYYYRIRATDSGGGGTGANSNTITVTTAPPPPAAPTANAASNVTDTSLSANWSSSAGATNYKLSVSTVAGCTSNYVTACGGGGSSCNLFVTGNVTTYAVTPLNANYPYYYCLKATNASGDSALSNIITQITAPAAPTISGATNITSTGFSANWSASTGATKYYLDVANDSGFTSYTGAVATACGGTSCQNKDVTNVTTYAVGSNLVGGTTYYYRVRAYSTNGTSNNSGTTIVTTVPAIPTVNPGVAVDSSSSSAGSNVASLTWSHTVSGSNRLLVVGVTMRAYTTITSITYAGTSLTKSGAVQAASGDYARTEIWYKVNPATGANNIVVTPGANDWLQAGAVSFTGVYPTTPLSAFASNSAMSGTTSTVSVSSSDGDIVLDVLKFWNNSGESTKDASQTQQWYLWSDGAHKGGSSTKAGSDGMVTMSWTRTDNNSWAHAGVSVKSYQSSITQTGFSANWSASTGATKYYLDVANNSGFTDYTGAVATACGGATCQNKDVTNVTTYAVGSNLTAGTTYYYRVRAYNASGTSTSSSPVTIITGPTANNASNVYSGNLQANWTAVSGATSYELDVATSSDFSSGFVSGYNPATGITTNYKMVSGLTPNTLYYYRVRVIKSGVTSGQSNTITTLTKPGSPTSVSANPINSSNFTVSWTAPTGGASSYKLDVATDATFTKFAPDASYGNWQNVTATSPIIVNNLFPSTAYYFRVRAVNANGLTSSNPTAATPSATTIAADVNSTTCPSSDNANTTISYSCSFLNALDGIGNGNLAVASGKSITLSNNQTIVWTPGKKIDLTQGGTIFLNTTGASLKQGYMTYPDADGDGYPDSLTPVFNATGIADGYKARYQMNAGYTLDCDPNLTTGGGGGNDCNTKTVFITSGSGWTGNLGGLSGADDKCNTAASNAGLTGYYRAWLSDGSTSAATRLNHYGYKYQLVDGTDVAYGWSDLTNASLQAAINKDEYGTTTSSAVWTNTAGIGVYYDPAHTCNNWTDTTGYVGTGLSTSTAVNWTLNTGFTNCTSTLPLYCIEQ